MNILKFGRSIVTFNSYQIDIPKFKELLAKGSLELEYLAADEQDKTSKLVQNFLLDNTYIGDDEIIVSFNSGKSRHTWENFTEVVNKIINPMILAPKSHLFEAKEENEKGKMIRFVVTFGEEFKR